VIEAPSHSGGSAAVLDIGGDKGALVIYSDAEMLGEEIEICFSGKLETRCHNVVRARRRLTDVVYAAVFPTLSEGEYDILDDSGIPTRQVSVAGGSVAEVDCRGGV